MSKLSPRSVSVSTIHSLAAAQPSPDASLYLGIDVSAYPGDTKMTNFFTPNTPFYFTGFYLAPAPRHPDTSWMNKKVTLEGIGYGFLIVYVGRQAADSNLTYAQGQTDGANAAALAGQAGFTNNFIYLDIEQGGTLAAGFIDYIKGWVDTVGSGAFKPGIYCSYTTADQIHNERPNAGIRFWVFRISPPVSPGCTTNVGAKTVSDCGVSYASSWQYAQSCTNQTWNGSKISPVDLDMSNYRDPSAP